MVKNQPRSAVEREALDVFNAYLPQLEAGKPFGPLVEQHPSLERPLRELYSDYLAFSPIESDLKFTDLNPGADQPTTGEAFQEVLRDRIRGLSDPASRLRVIEEIGKGGFGTVYLAEDSLLRRAHARKVLTAPNALHRFLEEAQVTAQLNHPGVVPVHDMGLDEEGRPFFSMGYVNGRSLDEIFPLARQEEEGWSVDRALETLLRVCDTVAYAHDRGVVHRDLKPANVMVGRYGDVFVMDWGLAKLEHSLAEEVDEEITSLRDESGVPADLYTVSGQVVGTPFYMSPEQARGKPGEVGPRSDVYALGAMIYTLLTGSAPFNDRPQSQREVFLRLLQESPTPLRESAPNLSAELEAICEKAMARDPQLRYSDMGELAEDLRAFRENRAVRAFDTSAWTQAKKWILRNRGIAATGAVALSAILIGGVVAAVGYFAVKDAEADIYRLASTHSLDNLKNEAAGLWPPHPAMLPALDDWIARANEVTEGFLAEKGGISSHYDRLLEERNAGWKQAGQESAEQASLSAGLSGKAGSPRTLGEVRELEGELQERVEPESFSAHFSDDQSRWWYLELEKLSRSFLEFTDPDHGLFGTEQAVRDGQWSVPRRRENARRLAAGFAADGEYTEAWEAAREGISSTYGFDLPVQMGWVPLGQNPESGLWEFHHLLSGAEPVREDEEYRVLDDSGMVFVLIQGGEYDIGAQADDAEAPLYDAEAKPLEQNLATVALEPFFLSKYELTQGQWLRLSGENPSGFTAGMYFSASRPPISLSHPVENLTTREVVEVLGRFELRLPSEAEWEVAARGSSVEAYGESKDISGLEHLGNIADQSLESSQNQGYVVVDWDDTWPFTAPVGRFVPTAHGLFDMVGNVREATTPFFPTNAGKVEEEKIVFRGSSWQSALSENRIAGRWIETREFQRKEVGFRVCSSVRGEEPAR